MNADASPQLAVDLQAGARTDLLSPISVGVLITGLLLLVVGVPLLTVGASGLGRDSARSPAPPAGPVASTGSAAGVTSAPVATQVPVHTGAPSSGSTGYPARLSGALDPQLSRWMWLVKWFLAIPHFIVLAFLWLAFVVTTIIAGFAILFTARYPRSLFEFNVGVLRWSWRVGFYAYSALGNRSVSAVHAGPNHLPCRFRRGVPGAALPRPRARQVVAAGNTAAGHRGDVHHTVVLGRQPRPHHQCPAKRRNLPAGIAGADRRMCFCSPDAIRGHCSILL